MATKVSNQEAECQYCCNAVMMQVQRGAACYGVLIFLRTPLIGWRHLPEFWGKFPKNINDTCYDILSQKLT